jgi:class I fructose-bisphosphate aldolase
MMKLSQIEKILGSKKFKYLFDFKKPKVDKKLLHTPSGDWVDRIFKYSDRRSEVLKNLKRIYSHGRLGGSGYLSILPVDQAIEHNAATSFVKNPIYFDPENIVKLAIEGGCSGVATTSGVLGAQVKKYVKKIPMILKINHNELLSYPNRHEQVDFASVDYAKDEGYAAIGATIYFGAEHSRYQISHIANVFEKAHDAGLATILWCYVRNSNFEKNGKNYNTAADITGQANHLGATIKADIVKQKMPAMPNGIKAVRGKDNKNDYGKYDEAVYNELLSDHPIDMVRFQVLNSYAGRIGLLNSGGASGKNDLQQAIYSAIINKMAGGMGLIMGRKAFQKPMKEGIKLLNAVQDIYLSKDIKVV